MAGVQVTLSTPLPVVLHRVFPCQEPRWPPGGIGSSVRHLCRRRSKREQSESAAQRQLEQSRLQQRLSASHSQELERQIDALNRQLRESQEELSFLRQARTAKRKSLNRRDSMKFFKPRRNRPQIEITKLSSLISEDVVITGDVSFSSGLRIDGVVRGSVIARPNEGRGRRAVGTV